MPTSTVPRIALLMPVGPGQAELDRAGDTLASFDHYVNEPAVAVLVDDAAADRDAAASLGTFRRTRLEPLHVPRPARAVPHTRGKGICAAILTGLGHIARRHSEVDFVLKLDTDALVIGPFAGRIRTFFRDHPGIGQIGAHDRTPGGETRETAAGAQAIRWLIRRPIDLLHPIAWLRQQLDADQRLIRRHIRTARDNGYAFGEHCQGGGYALNREALLRMADLKLLDRPEAWHQVDCPEDVMTGMYVRATGLRLAGYAAPGQVFGVRKRGLAYPPAELADKRYAVIHSVKNDEQLDESAVRDFFANRRHAEDAEADRHRAEVD